MASRGDASVAKGRGLFGKLKINVFVSMTTNAVGVVFCIFVYN